MSLSRLWRVENGGIYDESLHIMLFACLLWEKIFRRNEAKKPNPMGKYPGLSQHKFHDKLRQRVTLDVRTMKRMQEVMDIREGHWYLNVSVLL